MTIAYNRKKDQEKSRLLRNNMPKSEVILWSKLKDRQIDGERFLRQYGVEIYVLDFYCPRLKLAIEVDGDSHVGRDAIRRDRDSQDYIEAFGIRILRFTNSEVCENLDGVCQNIYETIEMIRKKNEGQKT
jgi:very-short-patch-repair endonuclease